MARTLTTGILLILLSQTAWAETVKLTDKENKGYARACFDVVVHGAFGQTLFDLSDGYSYWPTTVENIDFSGADISTIIELKMEVKSGDNNGWGQETKKVVSRYFECISKSVAKGKFPEPDYFLHYYAKGKVSPIVKQHFSGRGDGAYGGSCAGQSRLVCAEEKEEWLAIDLISSGYETSTWGTRLTSFYDEAKSRQPNKRVLNWSFE